MRWQAGRQAGRQGECNQACCGQLFNWTFCSANVKPCAYQVLTRVGLQKGEREEPGAGVRQLLQLRIKVNQLRTVSELVSEVVWHLSPFAITKYILHNIERKRTHQQSSSVSVSFTRLASRQSTKCLCTRTGKTISVTALVTIWNVVTYARCRLLFYFYYIVYSRLALAHTLPATLRCYLHDNSHKRRTFICGY